MSGEFIAKIIQSSTHITGVAAREVANDIVKAITEEMKKEGGFKLYGLGAFTVRKNQARKALNPKTGEKIKVKAGKTVRFIASPVLKKSV